MSVVPIRPGLNATQASAQLTGVMADTVRSFEEGGFAPTGAVCIVFDDNGNWRVGWDSRDSILPSNALMGLALNALVQRGCD